MVMLMGISAEKVAEVLALPQEDRAVLAHHLLASLDSESEAEWLDTIHRRSREIEGGKVSYHPVEQVVQDIGKKLHARGHPS